LFEHSTGSFDLDSSYEPVVGGLDYVTEKTGRGGVLSEIKLSGATRPLPPGIEDVLEGAEALSEEPEDLLERGLHLMWVV
jgi:hypothetical protein